jgi:hypothetical protein
MTALDQVLARTETDFDFYLAVQRDPRNTLAPYKLSNDEIEAFAQSGVSFWSLVLERIGKNRADKPDGGLPPPPPPFTVHYSVPTDFERWRGDAEAELRALEADPAVRSAVNAVGEADTPSARMDAVARLMARIG